MNRREFLSRGAACALAGHLGREKVRLPEIGAAVPEAAGVRSRFPRLEREVFLNAAGGTPLGRFAESAVERYLDFWRLGPGDGRAEVLAEMLGGIRAAFAGLIGAEAGEIALVPNTKSGEQRVLDSLPALRQGGNVVTDDLHFAGSLHNFEGLRRAGLDVRIVRHRDWKVSAESMAAAMDERTALVAVSAVSNVNGHVEPLAELADLAHRRGALLYADVVQAAGIVPLDVRALGIDVAACSGYKWLYGPHGAGFLYVAREHQGRTLPDLLVPGHARLGYPPWVPEPAAGGEAVEIEPRDDARRYEPGHHGYLGYAALYAGLQFVREIGVETALAHSVGLGRRLIERLNADRYRLLSPHPERSPVFTFAVEDAAALEGALARAGVTVSLAPGRLRVSPAIYNRGADVDRLAEVLEAVG